MTSPAPDVYRDGSNLLTNSRLSSARTCLRKHWYEYECGLRPIREADHFRIGTLMHFALERYDEQRGAMFWVERVDFVEWLIRKHYAATKPPHWMTPHTYACEMEALIALFRAHCWRWNLEDAEIQIVSLEEEFEVAITNPATGAESKLWRYGGKIDRKEIRNGRAAIRDRKTTSKDIGPDSDYWKQLRIDGQPTGYLTASRTLGFDAETVFYDVIRKPAIKPLNATPEASRKYTKDGKLYANLRDADESPWDYGKRVEADCYARPDFYFARVEIARTSNDIAEWQEELWQQQIHLREIQRTGKWFKNPGACLGFGKCPFLDLCTGGHNWKAANDPSSPVPEGFERLDYVHPELKGITQDA